MLIRSSVQVCLSKPWLVFIQFIPIFWLFGLLCCLVVPLEAKACNQEVVQSMHVFLNAINDNYGEDKKGFFINVNLRLSHS